MTKLLKDLQTIFNQHLIWFREEGGNDYDDFLDKFIGGIPTGVETYKESLLDFEWSFDYDTLDFHTLDECFRRNRDFIELWGWGFGQPLDTYELLQRYAIYQIREGEKDLFRGMWEHAVSPQV